MSEKIIPVESGMEREEDDMDLEEDDMELDNPCDDALDSPRDDAEADAELKDDACRQCSDNPNPRQAYDARASPA
jgi:hypothetical protein